MLLSIHFQTVFVCVRLDNMIKLCLTCCREIARDSVLQGAVCVAAGDGFFAVPSLGEESVKKAADIGVAAADAIDDFNVAVRSSS